MRNRQTALSSQRNQNDLAILEIEGLEALRNADLVNDF
jgi:hypothetical protein